MTDSRKDLTELEVPWEMTRTDWGDGLHDQARIAGGPDFSVWLYYAYGTLSIDDGNGEGFPIARCDFERGTQIAAGMIQLLKEQA